jgi:hypothetical protein
MLSKIKKYIITNMFIYSLYDCVSNVLQFENQMHDINNQHVLSTIEW